MSTARLCAVRTRSITMVGTSTAATRVLAVLVAFAVLGHGLQISYCSSDNTGLDSTAESYRYQSNGNCHDRCLADYAFAVLQGKVCWCSDYIPGNQTSTGDCNENCPGYPSDKCGNEAEGLYGYIALPNVQPSGTAGLINFQPSSTDAPSTQLVSISTTSIITPSSVDSPPTSQSFTFSSSAANTSPSPTPVTTPSSTSTTPTYTPTPVTSIEVVTVSGAVVTQTVTSTPLPTTGDGSANSGHDKGLSGGAIAGIVIGVLGGLALLLVGAFFLWRRRDTEAHGRPRDPNRPRRTTSVLSRTGLLSRGRAPSMAERDFDEPIYFSSAAATNPPRLSGHFGTALESVTVQPASPLGSSHGSQRGGAGERRHSRPMVYDQRLNPSALFANAEANGSRVSMQDQHDYSRPLGIANPDPRPSFESRFSHG